MFKAGVSSGSKTNMNGLRDLFYRSKFTELLRVIESLDHKDSIGGDAADLQLLKASIEFEKHDVAASAATLRNLMAQLEHRPDDNYLYAFARLNYLDDDHKKSFEIFLELVESSETDAMRFKALLGLANVILSQGGEGPLEAVIYDLKSFEPLQKPDDRISLLLFLGSYETAITKDFDKARQNFDQALSLSAREGWTYFLCRALYGLAKLSEAMGEHDELRWTLKTLGAMISGSECKLFSHIVNIRFTDHGTHMDTPMDFDRENHRICVNQEWIAFHDRPMLYRFLETLHENPSFVPKKKLATQLWPEEDYRPRVHDPRIFDIAKRARSLVESYENQPVVILSGRLGYKLAST